MEARRRLPCDADALESVQLKKFSAEVSCLGSHILSRYVLSTEESLMRSPGVLWIKAAVVYLVMGVGLGIYMGASGDHVMVPVHAHLNLLGWASLAPPGWIRFWASLP